MEGKVKFYDDVKGFGFIVGEDETEYFVHRSEIKEGRLDDDVAVTFEPTQGDRGPKAENVKVGTADSSDDAEAADEPEASDEPEAEDDAKEPLDLTAAE